MHLHVMFSLQKADMIIVNCCYLNLVKKKKTTKQMIMEFLLQFNFNFLSIATIVLKFFICQS